MDNFTIWVDAPTEALIETPVDDQSSGFLRDEIMLTQQYVLEKLDEQTEQDKGEQTDEQAAKSRELASQVQTESQRMHDIKKELNVFKESCKSIELQLVSVKSEKMFNFSWKSSLKISNFRKHPRSHQATIRRKGEKS